jgi:hypothetical protein
MGDGHVVDVVLADLVDHFRQGQTIGGETQLDVRRLFGELAHGVEGLLRIGQSVAGAGNAEHGHLGNLAGHGQHLLHRLIGGELLADHTRAALVTAVVLAIAVVALDVAGRRHCHVHTGKVVVGFFRVTGMVLDLVPDLGGHVVGATRRTTAGLAGPAGAGTASGGFTGGGLCQCVAIGFQVTKADVGALHGGGSLSLFGGTYRSRLRVG